MRRGQIGAMPLAARIVAAVAPDNVIEEIWVRDVVDLVWDVVRLRRFKAGLFRVGASDGMVQILLGLGVDRHTAREWAARIDQFERIERMLAAAEVRRAAALDAIENHRVAERLRAAAQEAERDAAPPIAAGEFTLVPETGM